MADVTQLLKAVAAGDRQAAEDLLPLVYQELRQLARRKLAHERPGQTLQPTALVHEAYLRLVGRGAEKESGSEGEGENHQPPPLSPSPALPHPDPSSTARPPAPSFHSRGHFFAAAAEAMRRILVESARAKQRLKRGGDLSRVPLEEFAVAAPEPDNRLLDLDAALAKLEQKDPRKAELVKLRYFAGLTIEQAAQALGIATSTADRDWSYARAWLFREMSTT